MNQEILVIMGPTGSGKTQILYEYLDQKFEVISADSRQVYKSMKIGTAVPDTDVLEKVPHHLIEIIEPDEVYSAGKFVESARKLISEIQKKGNIPVISGGTGFYFRAWYTGMFPFEEQQNEIQKIREKLNQLTYEEKLRILSEIDPQSITENHDEIGKGRIHPRDIYRIQRALEIYYLTGKTLRQHYQYSPLNSSDYPFMGFWIVPEKEIWLKNLYQRAKEMVKKGIIEEAIYVYHKYGNCAVLKTPGYKEIIELYIKNQSFSKEEIIEKVFTSHKKYGKNQITWFKKEKKLTPINIESLENYLKKLDFKILDNYLSKNKKKV